MSSSALLGDPIPAPPYLGGVFFKFLSGGVLLILVFFWCASGLRPSLSRWILFHVLVLRDPIPSPCLG